MGYEVSIPTDVIEVYRSRFPPRLMPRISVAESCDCVAALRQEREKRESVALGQLCIFVVATEVAPQSLSETFLRVTHLPGKSEMFSKKTHRPGYPLPLRQYERKRTAARSYRHCFEVASRRFPS